MIVGFPPARSRRVGAGGACAEDLLLFSLASLFAGCVPHVFSPACVETRNWRLALVVPPPRCHGGGANQELSVVRDGNPYSPRLPQRFAKRSHGLVTTDFEREFLRLNQNLDSVGRMRFSSGKGIGHHPSVIIGLPRHSQPNSSAM